MNFHTSTTNIYVEPDSRARNARYIYMLEMEESTLYFVPFQGEARTQRPDIYFLQICLQRRAEAAIYINKISIT